MTRTAVSFDDEKNLVDPVWVFEEPSASFLEVRGGLRVHACAPDTIGLLTRLPCQADLVVQGLPKIGLGGGPDAYFEVRDVGIVIAGSDEISVDLTAIRSAGVPGNPWTFNHPIHGALQFGRGPMRWDQIRTVSGADSTAVR